jgi:hypothetical protein
MNKVQTRKTVRPLWLFRRWRAAAGELGGMVISTAPFTALQLFGQPQLPLRERQNPALLDNTCRNVAQQLMESELGEQVRNGTAAFVLDLPAPVSLATGFHLQAHGVAPVLAFGGLYRPGAVIDGKQMIEALIRYGSQLRAYNGERGFAFLLERERGGNSDQPDDLTFWRTFDNRYRAGEHLFPPLPDLKDAGLNAFVDLRVAGDELPIDLNFFYRYAAEMGFNVYQAAIPQEWFG